MSDRTPIFGRGVWLAAAALGLALTTAVGWLLWRPAADRVYFHRHHPAAMTLAGAARAGPLTDAEFQRALDYLAAPTAAVRLAAMAIMPLEAARSPERKAVIVERLTALTADPEAGPSAARTLARLTAPPPG
jgi:hypothetical protein